MNINFHYYAVKALARCAGFEERDAQIIAEYSQFIDDYSTKNTINVDGAPQTAINSGLAVQGQDGNFKVKLVTTGFGSLMETVALISEDLQNRMLIPFHFIIPFAMNENNKDFVTIPATLKDGQLISNLLEETQNQFEESDLRCLIKVGCLTHIFADTHAHQGFSGHRIDINDYKLFKYERRINRLAIPENFENETKENMALYSKLPKIGHSTVGHAPDDTYCKYEFKHRNNPKKYPDRVNDNYSSFLTIAREIYDYFRILTGAENDNFAHFQDIFLDGFLANNYNESEMVEKWSQACLDYPNLNDIQFSYDKNTIMRRLFTNLPHMDEEDFHEMLESMLRTDEPPCEEPEFEYFSENAIYEDSTITKIDTNVTHEFWYFTEFADSVRERVARGFYKR